ncbi:GspH/FimT family pseudopilin [Xanthomonas phaseoli]|uniref:Type II secretion system protein H n=2 Tax=Xanthomonas TaxID=338 RepID=A0A8I1XNJ2_XANMN|nr:GspH/FimT family pseudopilin [Xanthomonas phaseoli]MBO9720102.1 GspH/FimT family pseudopilin [Xanthomonas phaseoli pv. manihotis]MBO9757557.1 GspH/FimT family pseudopilin [Xanthomonas phaseoli pv. manihotis]MBO9760805.1 GspH/FimT family pseudopilin [Xanthomonas phaseoli pv. manihotis]MBO9765962.1 GspH/FimT family pseudopilin [Xanthomonas phaseoli pv. manihotis]MBO9785395.1 GspH/FimT family pseudopilin [Xanthomonas phaseoli pv. manihotis]
MTCIRGPTFRVQLGFSLIEMMVTIIVLAIVMAIAFPNFTALINSNRLSAAANELSASLQLARSEAVRSNASVTLCPSNDGATCANSGNWARWIVLRGTEVLRVSEVRPQLLVSVSSAISSANSRIVFRPDGLARDSTGARLLVGAVSICMATTRPPENQRMVAIAGGSRVAITRGTDPQCQTPADAPALM